MSNGAVILLSGGLDSVTVFHHCLACGSVAGALSFDYGSKHNERELACAREHARSAGVRHDVVSLPFVDRLFTSDLLRSGGDIPNGHYAEASMRCTVVPFRNGIMLAVAAGYAESIGAGRVVIAAHAGDHPVYPDCREVFMEHMGAAMRLGTYAGVALDRPFIALDKAAIVRRGYELGIDYTTTWSCYKGGRAHCGVCGTCVERREAFALAGVDDPTEYVTTGPLPPAP